MADDLFFSSLEIHPEVPPKGNLPAGSNPQKSPQHTDFKSVLLEQVNERIVSDKKSPVRKSVDIDDSISGPDQDDTLVADGNGSLKEDLEDDAGKGLPVLAVHDRAFEVGRLILTTAKPLVNDTSLSEFARNQVLPRSGSGLNMDGAGRSLQAGSSNEKSAVVKGSPEFSEQIDDRLRSALVKHSDLANKQMSDPGPIVLDSDSQASKTALPLNKAQSTIDLISQNLNFKVDRPAADKIGESSFNLIQSSSHYSSRLKEKTTISDHQKLSEKGSVGKEKAISQIRLIDEPDISKGEQFFKRDDEFISKSESQIQTGHKILRASPQDLFNKASATDSFDALSEGQLAKESIDNSELIFGKFSEPQKKLLSTSAQDMGQDLDVRPRMISKEFPSLGEMLTSKPETKDGFLRTEQYVNWSQRFGQILGQRLSVAIKNGSWNVKLNLHPSTLGHVDISLDISEKGIEGQISSNDPIARQLLQDSLSKLRATLSELYDQEGSINLSMGDKEKSGSRSEKPDNSFEVSIDLLAEDFALEDGQVAGVSGLDLFV